MKYKPVPVPEDLIGAINEMDLFTNKIQINHFDSDHLTTENDYSDNNEAEGQTGRKIQGTRRRN